MHRADAQALISEAAEWRLIALLLERPRAGWQMEVAALAREVPHQGLRTAAHAARDASEGEYLHLVGPGGIVSPREVSYRSFEDPGRILADLAASYAAFAFQPRAEESPDHLAVEAGFIGYLLLKEAFAVARGDTEAASTTAAARSRFLEGHLTAAHPFAERLAAGGSYLAAVACVLAERVPEHLSLCAEGDGAADVTCGACVAPAHLRRA
jgi:nitrate reductase assembly molybdenum cofactor insertion protein NarJ